MKFSSILLALSTASTVLAIPHSKAHEELHHKHEARQNGYTAVTGTPGTVYPRLEIRQMYFNRPNQYTLLILALQKFQQMSQDDKMSYYQISGIHGVPRQNWDGVGQCDSCGGTDGYCTHDSVLFPAWHRVYLALFEQQFLSIVNEIAQGWTGDGASTIQAAASQMRWPYWDWAAQPKPGYKTFPAVMSMKYVTVNTPSGSEVIFNPLFRYQFADNSGLVYYPFVNNWGYTFRYPTTDANSATSSTAKVVSAFENIRSSLQDQVWQLFSTCTDYLHFSNDDAGTSSTSCSNSLEGIHNTVHMTTGGTGNSSVAGGHMAYLSLAAFDPVFWLHHTNVDRIFAMWQTINPNSYGGSQVAPHNTWTIAQGTTQDENSPLAPMHKDTDGNFYTTNDVRDWTRFGYTYPEFSDSDGSASAINSYINALYGPSASATAGSSKRTAAAEPIADTTIIPTGAAASAFASVTESSISGALPTPTQNANPLSNLTTTIANSTAVSNLTDPIKANNGSLFQYVANIQTPRYALNGSYNIYLFNGPPTSEEPASWLVDQNLIGPVGVLAQPGMTEHNVTVAASVPLTRSLTYAISDGVLTDLSEELVEPYLKNNLKYRIQAPDGSEISSESLPGFDINIYGSTAQIPGTAGQLPQYSDFVLLQDAKPNCTQNAL